MKFLKNTPIMVVEEIESCLPFWEDVLGYRRTVEVPHEGRLGFVLLVSDDVQVMFQSRASILADLAGQSPADLASQSLADELEVGAVVQYLDIDSIDELIPRLDPEMVVIGERKTFYGAREVFVRAPGGFICGFAEHGVED